MRPRVLGLGNELLGDDSVGIEAARRIRQELSDQVDVVETSVYGLGLLDVILGCRQLIIIDAIRTGKWPVGCVMELDPRSLDRVLAPSPHYSGLPEMKALAEALELAYPKRVKVFAIEIGDNPCFGAPIDPAMMNAVDHVVCRVKQQLARWRCEELRDTAVIDCLNVVSRFTSPTNADDNGPRREVSDGRP
jgi:hydrogenase maturation protease